MGYTTDFTGKFTIDPPLNTDQVAYLKALAETRRVKRDAKKVKNRPDILRSKVNLPVGVDGEFYVGSFSDGYFGQSHTKDIVDYNSSPRTQPFLWLQWVPSDDGASLEWNGGEKFYGYVEWLQYLIENFFVRWDVVLEGTVIWKGEDNDDFGRIDIKDSKITVLNCGTSNRQKSRFIVPKGVSNDYEPPFFGGPRTDEELAKYVGFPVSDELLVLNGTGHDSSLKWDHKDPVACESVRGQVEALRQAGYVFFLTDGRVADAVTAAEDGILVVRKLTAAEVVEAPVPDPADIPVGSAVAAGPAEESAPGPKKRGRRTVVATKPLVGG